MYSSNCRNLVSNYYWLFDELRQYLNIELALASLHSLHVLFISVPMWILTPRLGDSSTSSCAVEPIISALCTDSIRLNELDWTQLKQSTSNLPRSEHALSFWMTSILRTCPPHRTCTHRHILRKASHLYSRCGVVTRCSGANCLAQSYRSCWDAN